MMGRSESLSEYYDMPVKIDEGIDSCPIDDLLIKGDLSENAEYSPSFESYDDKDISTEGGKDLYVEKDLSDDDSLVTFDESAVDITDDIKSIDNIQEWLDEINPNYDPFDMTSDYNNNCGSCAFAVLQRLEGKDADIVATAKNIGTVEEMNEITGMEQTPMSPDEIKEYLISQGPGANGIVGIDRAEGPGHWFNAYYDGEKVVAIDGQTGEATDWPPDYGDVTNWDISVKKEDTKNE